PRLTMLGTIPLRNPADVLYFPAVPRPASTPVVQQQSIAPARDHKSVAYPGPQEIVSNFQDPTNFIQTILQPALQNPSILKPPFLMPNILQMPNAAPIPTITVPTASAKPAAVEAPKLVIPETKPSSALPKSVQPLLAVTPMPASAVQPPTVPAGEARGN